MITIIGDSYGHIPKPKRNMLTWIKLLAQQEALKNLCQPSAGPYACLNLLDSLSLMDKLIFILSDKNRLNFPFIKHPNHISSCFAVNQEMELVEEEKYLLNWKHEISLVFNMFTKEIDRYPFLIVLYLKHLSEKYDTKILILPAFNSITDIDSFNYNSDNFKVCNLDLYTISMNEFKHRNFIQEVEQDRLNHLSQCNHTILFNVVSNFFYNTNYSEEFKEDLYDQQGNIIKRFIYD